MGWNLPPGCSVNDLPGNSAEDEAFERFKETIWDGEGNVREEFEAWVRSFDEDGTLDH